MADFTRFIVIESLKEVYQAKFPPFCVKKIPTDYSKNVKKARNNLLAEMVSRGQAENIKNENISYDEMQSQPPGKSYHFQRSNQK